MLGQNSEDLCFKGITDVLSVGRRHATPASLLLYKQGLAPAILCDLLVYINRVAETGLH